VDSAGDPDVLIIGGGPAGCATAIASRRAGLRVRLVARRDRREERPGEALLPGTEPLLRQLGLDRPVLAAGFLRHRGHWVEWSGERRFEPFGEDAGGPWLGFQAWRASFDAILQAEARRAGVVVEESSAAAPIVENGRVVGAVTGGRAVRTQVVVDASGTGRWLARHLQLAVVEASPRLVAWCGYVEGECPRHDECPTIAADAGGWTWLARVRSGLYQWIRMPFDGRRPAHDWLPPDFAGLSPTGRPRGADATWRHVPASAGDGYFLVGDAAIMLDPLSSHGVLKALMSGILTGDLTARMLRGGLDAVTAARHYRRWQAEWFARDTLALRSLYASMPEPPSWARTG
jgi:flavin-dependent dehydrogenase